MINCLIVICKSIDLYWHHSKLDYGSTWTIFDLAQACNTTHEIRVICTVIPADIGVISVPIITFLSFSFSSINSTNTCTNTGAGISPLILITIRGSHCDFGAGVIVHLLAHGITSISLRVCPKVALLALDDEAVSAVWAAHAWAELGGFVAFVAELDFRAAQTNCVGSIASVTDFVGFADLAIPTGGGADWGGKRSIFFTVVAPGNGFAVVATILGRIACLVTSL